VGATSTSRPPAAPSGGGYAGGGGGGGGGDAVSPPCRCGEPSVQRTVTKPGDNLGKVFFTCPKPRCVFEHRQQCNIDCVYIYHQSSDVCGVVTIPYVGRRSVAISNGPMDNPPPPPQEDLLHSLLLWQEQEGEGGGQGGEVVRRCGGRILLPSSAADASSQGTLHDHVRANSLLAFPLNYII
jgi:hypothetical protein